MWGNPFVEIFSFIRISGVGGFEINMKDDRHVSEV